MTHTDSLPLGSARFGPPTGFDRALLVALLLIALIDIPAVIYLTVAKGFGDVQVFFRAGWAIGTGYPIYEIVDRHGWSYHYLPSFAFLMIPFGDPMPDFPRPAWAMPYAVSVGVWTAINIVAMAAALHVWATALERFSGVSARPGTGTPAIALRAGPAIAFLPYILVGFARGQPTALLILLVVGFLFAYADGRRVVAALLLSLAITLKMFPAVFGLFLLLRGDWRTILWTALFSALLIFALPALILGVGPTVELYRTLWTERLAGIAGGDIADRVRAELSPWTLDMVAIGPMLARTFETAVRGVTDLPRWAALAQYAADAIILGLLVVLGYGRYWRFGGPQPAAPYAILIAGSILLAALPAMLPVAQPHYWAQVAPLAAVLLVESWRRAGVIAASPWLAGLAILAWLAYGASEASFLPWLRQIGPTTIVMLIYIAAGFVVLARLPKIVATPIEARRPAASTPVRHS